MRNNGFKAPKESGYAHVAKLRQLQIEEHYADCGEDLSFLTGVDTCSLAWATTLQVDARPLLADAEHSVECDGISSVMLLGPLHTLGMRNLRVVQLQRHHISGILEHMAPASGGSRQASRSRLAIRRKLDRGTRMDFMVSADLTIPSTSENSGILRDNSGRCGHNGAFLARLQRTSPARLVALFSQCRSAADGTTLWTASSLPVVEVITRS